jgi:Fic family protein
MRRGITGKFISSSTTGETVRAFVPSPLPPVPALQIEPSVRGRLDSALLALGRLDSISTLLPDRALFLYAYVRREAVLSSQIEGTQSSLSDLLLFEIEEAPGVPLDDVTEVSNYVAAMEHGLRRLREGFPLSNRLICEMHGILLSSGRGANRQPGEFRRVQNWIGGSRPSQAVYVPPPPDRVTDCMTRLEKWFHDDPEPTSALIKAALAHVQFETVHPFLDGNGRVGRLLVTLVLCAEGVLLEPLLYLSLYFKARRAEYYAMLNAVRTDGDWEAWVEFFAEGVIETAEGAVKTAQRLAALFESDRGRIQSLVSRPGSVLQVHAALQARPVSTIARLAEATNLTLPTVASALGRLQEQGLVREVTGRRRRRVFSYEPYLRILSEGTS